MQLSIPLIMMFCYILIVLFLSYKASFAKKIREMRKKDTFEEYYTAGKSMNVFTVAMISIVTFYSGTTFTGRVGFFYSYGVVGMNTVFACATTGIVMFFLSEKIWPLSKKYRMSTLPDMMELRYQSKELKFLISLTMCCFNIIWLITEIRTLGFAMNIASGYTISTTVGSAIAFAIIVIYVMTGGVRSVAAVDSFSAVVMLGGSLLTFCYAIAVVFEGDFVQMMEIGATVNEGLMTINSSNAYAMPYWASGLIMSTISMLVYPGNYMGICLAKSVKTVKKSAIATALSGPWLAIYGFIGLAVLAAESQGMVLTSSEMGFLEMLNYAGSPIMLGLTVTFILAASLGTLDSTLISMSGLLSNDVVTNGIRIKNGDPCIGQEGDNVEVIAARLTKNAKAEIFRTRVIVVILGVLAFGFSLTSLPMLVVMANYASSGLIQIIPAVMGGLYWKKATTQGAVASLVIGIASFITMDKLVALYEINLGGMVMGIPALCVSIIVYIVVCNATHKKYYEEHTYAQGIYDDFFIKGRVDKYIAENMK